LEPPSEQQWHALGYDDVAELVGSSSRGLSALEAAERRRRLGANELAATRGTGVLRLIASQIVNPLILLLVAASVVSLVAGHTADAAVILVVVVFNAVMGSSQEWRAEKAIEALKDLSAPRARVLRDGAPTVVDARDVVVGDVLVLETGDRVAADARIMEAVELAIDESSLTGESEPVFKDAEQLPAPTPSADQTNMARMTSAVTAGRGLAVVVLTGMDTAIGRIAEEVQATTRSTTPLQARMARMGTALGIFAVVSATVLFVVGLLSGIPFVEMLLFSVAAAVSAIPEGLPAVMSVVLAVGVQRMSKRHAIVRRLAAVETLGSTTVVCSDKTGTITRNQMTVEAMWTLGRAYSVTGGGFDPAGEITAENDTTPVGFDDGEAHPDLAQLIEIGALANNAGLEVENGKWKVEGNPTDGALLVVARKAGLVPEALEARSNRLDEVPFSSRHKYMATLEKTADRTVLLAKGAPERILAASTHALRNGEVVPFTPELRREAEQVNRSLASQAYRVVAGAYREFPDGTDDIGREHAEHGLTFVGLWGLVDPPREEAVRAVLAAQRAGIRVVMITGDHVETALAIARIAGIAGETTQAMSGSDLDAMDDAGLAARVQDVAVFARVSPEHKLRIVDALSAHGEIVAMTGDGVNDAPALKKADIGIAMGVTGTEVAKEAADMVLADDCFATIIHAIEEGRVIFSNLRRVVAYLLSTAVAEVLLVFCALLAGLPLPLTAVMILWVNLVADGICSLPLGLEPRHDDVLRLPPRPVGEALITRPTAVRIAVYGTTAALGTLLVFVWEIGLGDPVRAQTMAFTTIAAFEWFKSLAWRSGRASVFRIGLFANRLLLVALGVGVLLQILAVQTPMGNAVFSTVALSLGEWTRALAMGSTVLVADMVWKFARRDGRATDG